MNSNGKIRQVKLSPSTKTKSIENNPSKSSIQKKTTKAITAKANTNNAVSFQKPVPLGVSCSNSSDFKRAGICSAGTLGFVIKDPAGQSYVVSCAHVFVNVDPSYGYVGKSSAQGDIIAQPGDLDAGCNPDNIKNSVAYLYQWSTINSKTPSTEIDLAVAKIIPNKITAFDTVIDIGAPHETSSHNSPLPKLNQVVQKSGRTTGLTYGRVDFAYVDMKIVYETPTGTPFNIEYRDLMVMSGTKFSASGDAGALILSKDNQPVGLLFAGNERYTVAFSIRSVLRRLDNMLGCGVTIVGTPKDYGYTVPSTELNGALAAKYTLKQILKDMKEFIGIGVGKNDINQIFLVVFIHSNDPAIKNLIPTSVNGYNVNIEIIKNIPKAF